jgi:hypothetical protein
MVQYCIVYGCKNSGNEKGVSFHHFPKDEVLKKKWVARIRRGLCNKPISNTMRVCSSHFVQEDYQFDVGLDYGIPSKRKKLKEDAVPSVFSFTSPRKLKEPRRRLVRHTLTSNQVGRYSSNPYQNKLFVLMVIILCIIFQKFFAAFENKFE